MKNLEKLVGIRSDENGDLSLEFLKTELNRMAQEVAIFGDETNQNADCSGFDNR